jgi:hypothetical protein
MKLGIVRSIEKKVSLDEQLQGGNEVGGPSVAGDCNVGRGSQAEHSDANKHTEGQWGQCSDAVVEETPREDQGPGSGHPKGNPVEEKDRSVCGHREWARLREELGYCASGALRLCLNNGGESGHIASRERLPHAGRWPEALECGLRGQEEVCEGERGHSDVQDGGGRALGKQLTEVLEMDNCGSGRVLLPPHEDESEAGGARDNLHEPAEHVSGDGVAPLRVVENEREAVGGGGWRGKQAAGGQKGEQSSDELGVGDLGEVGGLGKERDREYLDQRGDSGTCNRPQAGREVDRRLSQPVEHKRDVQMVQLVSHDGKQQMGNRGRGPAILTADLHHMRARQRREREHMPE